MNIFIKKNSSFDHEIENEVKMYDTSFAKIKKIYRWSMHTNSWNEVVEMRRSTYFRHKLCSCRENLLSINAYRLEIRMCSSWYDARKWKKMKWSRRKLYVYALMKTNNVSRVQNYFIVKIFVKIIDCFINNLHVFNFTLQLFYSFEQLNVIDLQRR
jgi:hypothetical protein